jgi:hypothetical protein
MSRKALLPRNLMSKIFYFSFVLTLIGLSARVSVAGHNWGPWKVVYGDATAGVDLHYVEEAGVWTNWFWEFHNRYSTKIVIRYTWTRPDGSIHKDWMPLDPGQKQANTNGTGATFPDVVITAVEFRGAPQSGSSESGAIQSGNVLEFPGPGKKVSQSPSPRN